MNYKVSVIVPVYNVENYLDRCLNSLANQTLEEIEIIVVNDGSPDQSQAIIDKYVNKFPNRFFSYIKENGGLGNARNFGLNYVRSEFIGFLDGDDYVDEDLYEKMYLSVINEKSDLVVCGIQYEWEATNKTFNLNGLKKIPGVSQNKSIFLSPLFAWNKLYKKSLFDKYKLKYTEKLWYEDIPVTFPFFAHAKNVSSIEGSVVHYIQRPTSIMGSTNNKKIWDIFEILEIVKKYFEENNLYTEFKEELEYLYIEQLILFGSFRFLRSNESSALITHSLDYINSINRDWKENRYIKFLGLSYRMYIKTFSKHFIFIYKLIIKLKGN